MKSFSCLAQLLWLFFFRFPGDSSQWKQWWFLPQLSNPLLRLRWCFWLLFQQSMKVQSRWEASFLHECPSYRNGKQSLCFPNLAIICPQDCRTLLLLISSSLATSLYQFAEFPLLQPDRMHAIPSLLRHWKVMPLPQWWRKVSEEFYRWLRFLQQESQSNHRLLAECHLPKYYHPSIDSRRRTFKRSLPCFRLRKPQKWALLWLFLPYLCSLMCKWC